MKRVPSYQSLRQTIEEADAVTDELKSIINPGPSAIERVEDSIARIEAGDADADQVRMALAFKHQLSEVYRSVTFRFEQAVVAWLEKNGELEDGVKRYYVGKDTSYKCRSVSECFKAILAEHGGDLDLTLTALSSGAFKPATAMKMLGPKGPAHFETVIQQDIKTGAPRKRLKEADERFQ